jgi:hypothetical protein
MDRRQAMKIVTLGVLVPAAWDRIGRAAREPDLAWAPGSYRLRFFSEEENRFLDELMEMIIPADEHSPGASAAQVSLFADRMVSSGDTDEQRNWKTGLKLMRDKAAAGSIDEALANAAAGESDPHTEIERFFVMLKRMTVNGYYTSEIGIHQDLSYDGNTYLTPFPGCEPARHPHATGNPQADGGVPRPVSRPEARGGGPNAKA